MARTKASIGVRISTICVAVAMGALLPLAVAPTTGHAGVLPPSADSKGTDFWLAFPGNLSSPQLTLFITGETTTTGTVTVPGLGFSSPFSVTPGTVTSVALPSTAELSALDGVEDKGIRVAAVAEVTVYGLNRVQFTTDAYLGLPADILGTEYIALGYANTNIVNGTQLAVAGAHDATTVTITPSVTTGGHAAGVPYAVSLNAGQAYQLRNTDPAPADLSGTIVTSDKPVAVFGGHKCANIPGGAVACDHVVEQMFPASTWGKSFVTMPLATRTGGDTFRILAGTDGTDVVVNGAPVATLNRGQLFEQVISGPAHVTADQPVLVAQYSNSSSFDGVTSDPFEMLVPPFEQFLSAYTVTTPASGFANNFINVVAPDAAVGAVTLDGAPIPPASFTPIAGSGFSGAQLPVGLGSHTLAGSRPFGVFVYGFDSFDSYGYPGGLSLAPVAEVTSVTLTPETASNPVGEEHCVTATVLDQNNLPLAGVRVDFAVAGANPTVASAFTDANGEAPFCYTGGNAGADTITATVGTISDTAVKNWTMSSACPAPSDFDGDGKSDVTVYRPLGGTWYVNQSSGTVSATAFGDLGDVPAAADYDGDGRTDHAVFRPSTGVWFVNRSTGGITATAWGQNADVPVPADYDGDGQVDLAVFRPSTGTWIINQSSGGAFAAHWGEFGDIPLVGDFDGDGRSDLTVYRPIEGTWYLNRTTAGITAAPWGTLGDVPVAGDYDGDCTTDLTVFRPSTGLWFAAHSSGGASFAAWGTAGDRPVAGDYDGDGRYDFTVYRPLLFPTWYLNRTTDGPTAVNWGTLGDQPVPLPAA